MTKEKLNPEIQKHYEKAYTDVTTQTNHIRREFIKRYNAILGNVVLTLQQKGSISEQALKNYIAGNYLLSYVAVNRYINLLVIKDVIVFDKEKKIYFFPKFLKDLLKSSEKTPDEAVGQDGSGRN